LERIELRDVLSVDGDLGLSSDAVIEKFESDLRAWRSVGRGMEEVSR
jgi:hypothetical protein